MRPWSSEMLDLSAALPPPPRADHPKIGMWIDEQIWGHRIWDSQTPWLTFLEFLTVAEACSRDGALLGPEARTYPLMFQPEQRIALRNILFNDDALHVIAHESRDDRTAWERWLRSIGERAVGVPSRDFSYLRERFPTFRDFASLVSLFRSSVVESNTNRRWGSRFVFPFGSNALYEDLDFKGGNASRDYVNFGRTGELLYLMLSRSSLVDELRPRVAKLIDTGSPWNRLLGVLQPPAPAVRAERGKSYLPYSKLASFDRLATDWMSILSLRLPGFDALPHLVCLSSLHVALYQLEVARARRRLPSPHFVCEVIAPKKTLVRDLSIHTFQDNERVTLECVDEYVSSVARTPAWHVALGSDSPLTACRQALSEACWWGDEPDDYEGSHNPAELLANLRRLALARHKRDSGNVHRSYGREIGLVSKRASASLRYAPSDAFLKAVILANVDQRLEYGAFLDVLFRRYGFIFGEKAAHEALDAGDYDQAAFSANSKRLEQRLSSLGFLRRLSDACAYVQNPFSQART